MPQLLASATTTRRRVLIVSSPSHDTPANAFARQNFPNVSLTQLVKSPPGPSDVLVLDIDLADLKTVASVRDLFSHLQRPPVAVFAVDGGAAMHFQTTQANALGARAVVERPLDRAAIHKALADLEVTPADVPIARGSVNASIQAAQQMIGASFEALSSGAPLELGQAVAASQALFSGIGQAGLQGWLDTVRVHHAGTYQHCMLVTGAVVAYAAHANLPEQPRITLTIAALLHDIGKAAIPNEILDKPDRLTEAEFTLVKSHPRVGADYLRTQRNLSAAIVDVVLHHHEFLDAPAITMACPESRSGWPAGS